MLPKAAVVHFAVGAIPLVFAQGPYPITGVLVNQGSNGVPLRQNINDLQAAGGAQWDLYIRSLVAMQQLNYTDPLSYFQVEGIHGQPFIEWDGTGPSQGTGWGGYCPHGEELFVSWHRPYVCLFEQLLVDHARKIATMYPQTYRLEYMQAAEQLRAPYWDWAADPTVPSATVPATLQVNFPNGQALQQRHVDNPLGTFIIPQAVLNGQYGTFDALERPRVLRCEPPQSYPASANNQLASRQYKQWVYDAFSRAANFTTFALMGRDTVSLELIHNNIHNDATCGQQFSTPDLSAFDPLFMLHHSNVDRLWAYWQAIWPEQDIFHDSYPGLSRFSTPEGTVITSQSPLQPFFARHRVPHTTESVRSIKNFGYSYLGLEFWMKTPAQMKQDATSLINQMYSTEISALRRSTPHGQLQQTRRYFAHIQLDRADIDKPCEIAVYVYGKRASSLAIMRLPETGIITAGLPLDKVLQGSSHLQSMSSEAAANSIGKSLKVKIVKHDGSLISNVPSLKVKLEDVLVTPPLTGNQFPKFSDSGLRAVNVSAEASLGVF